VISFFPFLPYLFHIRRIVVLVVVMSLPCITMAQATHPGDKQNRLSEKVSEELGKVRSLVDAKNWDGAVSAIDLIMKSVPSDGFDYAQLCVYKFQYLLNKESYTDAIEPLESAVRLNERINCFPKPVEADLLLSLAWLYYQDFFAKDRTPEQQKQSVTKAAEYAQTFFKKNLKAPTPENRALYATILYQLSTIAASKEEKIGLLKKARKEVEEMLYMSARPKEAHIQLLVSIVKQEGDNVAAAEYLELLAKLNPSNKSYWQQLVGTYLEIAAEKANDPRKAFENSVRAILTVERAQANGFLNSSRENFNLVGLYMNIQQYERAAELMESGLRKGTIESEQKNWVYLAESYRQINKEFKAIEILREASRLFPQAGSLHYMIAQYYALLEKEDLAYKSGIKAIEVGNIERTGQVYAALAYWAYDLRKYDEALAAVNKALEYPESKEDPQLPRLRTAIFEAIKVRNFRRGDEPDSSTKPEEFVSPDNKKQA